MCYFLCSLSKSLVMDMPQDSDVSRETSLNLRLDLSSFSKSNSITNDTPSFNVVNSTEIDTNVTKSLLDFNELVRECTKQLNGSPSKTNTKKRQKKNTPTSYVSCLFYFISLSPIQQSISYFLITNTFLVITN